MSSEVAATIIIAAFGSTGLWTLINQIVTAVIEKRKEKKESPEKDMLLGLGYAVLVHACNMKMKEGWIDPGELHEIDKYLFEPYKKLGGNGSAESMMKKISGLPNTPPEKED